MRIFKTTKLKTNGIKRYKPSQIVPQCRPHAERRVSELLQLPEPLEQFTNPPLSYASARGYICTKSHLVGVMCDQVKSLTDIVCTFIKIRSVIRKKLKNERDE